MPRTLPTALVLALLAVLATAGAAHAGPGEGSATLTLDGPAGTRLTDRDVRLAGSGGAEAFGTRVVLPVTGGRVGSSIFALGTRGAIRLVRGGRSITLRDVELQLGSSVWITARLGGRRRPVLVSTTGVRPVLDRRSGRARLRSGKLRLAVPAAGIVRRALGIREIGLGSLGTLTLDATVAPDLAGTAAGAGTSAPARPATAVDVTAATLDWHVRESFIRYVNTGEGTRVLGGAVAPGKTVRPGTSVPLDYDFRFPFASGWYDPASDLAVLTFRGGVGFSYRDHGIQFETSDPQLELRGAGSGSRATFSFTGRDGTPFDGRRATLLDLDPAAATRSGSADGATRTLTDVPGAVPAQTQGSVFNGFYAPGDPFGAMTVTFTTTPGS
ncbi:HtaA domain-containing protein [Paraconexibacter algicola]|uniref:Htaa domain-containing protein n=1 Tax=Paraconexibacter algicola TaxID=2133960 RepID=A0A2T4UGX7_9ACTN|nr:HtaA domain-containing protein [Paraconexibacter algicola]PTL58516.1 hypothetical protein C7Y72_02010 [Paraconexibacter algicola]